MQDLSGLIALRKLLIIAGKKDETFPINGVIKGYETVKKIYKEAGCENNVKLIQIEMWHYWCKDIV